MRQRPNDLFDPVLERLRARLRLGVFVSLLALMAALTLGGTITGLMHPLLTALEQLQHQPAALQNAWPDTRPDTGR